MKLTAIRGATTSAADIKEDIEKAAVELYNTLILENKLQPQNIVCITVGSTADITAYYPATAIRLSGCSAPLFSTSEPNITDSLPLCIRLLVLCYCKKPKHIYLNGAKNLKEKQ